MIFAAIAFSFFLFRVLPGDPSVAISGDPRLPTATREMLNKMFGLDKPLFEQFFVFVANVLQGNLGISFRYKLPVIQILMERLWNTLILLVPATILSVLLGILMGLIASWHRGTLIDTMITSLATLFWSIPSFWGGMMMVYLFAVNIPLFPTGGMVGYLTINIGWSNVGEILYHLFLPMITYSVIYSGQYTLVLRNSLNSVLAEDFMQLIKAKGYTDFEAIRKHALKNASLPLMTLIGLNFGYMLLGSITIETVFTWPGLGRLIYEAVSCKDYSLLQGLFLFFSTAMILMTVTVDILYMYIDPRVRLK
jgi:peptide/nickel transport system permease protein